jgi:hypothetical protein
MRSCRHRAAENDGVCRYCRDQKDLGGDGQLVYGICGYKGLNLDAISLVVGSESKPDNAK